MWPTPKVAYLLLAAHSLLVSGSPVDAEAVDAAVLAKRQCPQIHVFGARETTVSPGYGTAGTVVNLILGAFPGATAEAISYPACGGQSSCGGVQYVVLCVNSAYGDSARQGTNAVASAVNSLHQRCPNTQIVLVGYSQGGQIIDNAVCGGPDTGSGITTTTPPISASALNQVKAVIEMGSPRFVAGLSYNVGTCTAQGFAARPRGYVCGSNSASKIQSYCDSTDPYCCTGNDANSHQQYGNKYGQQALAFVKARLSSSGGGDNGGTPTTSAGGSVPTGGNGGGNGGSCSALYGQCGGQGWNGPTCCSQGTCKAANQWYSQCL
ncbi:carbohydrate esterase family 5 protein [Corynascus similis CBS 632.67]